MAMTNWVATTMTIKMTITSRGRGRGPKSYINGIGTLARPQSLWDPTECMREEIARIAIGAISRNISIFTSNVPGFVRGIIAALFNDQVLTGFQDNIRIKVDRANLIAVWVLAHSDEKLFEVRSSILR
jgi:hypothetical protein